MASATVWDSSTGGEQVTSMVADPPESVAASGAVLVITGTRTSGTALLASVSPSAAVTWAVTAMTPAGSGGSVGIWTVTALPDAVATGSSCGPLSAPPETRTWDTPARRWPIDDHRVAGAGAGLGVGWRGCLDERRHLRADVRS